MLKIVPFLLRKGAEHSLNEKITKDGRTILCKCDNSPLNAREGECVGLVSLGEDITMKKQQADERNEQIVDLDRFNKAQVEREKRIMELKKLINQLYRESGREVPYKSIDDDKT